MDKRKKAILLALALGDGHIQYQGGRSATLLLEHSQQQFDYLSYKINLLHKILGGKQPVIVLRKRFDIRTQRTYSSCRTAKTHRYFRVLRSWLYPNGKKKYLTHLLNKLTPEAIAIWYMDDGNGKFRVSKKTGNISSSQTYLGTYCSLEEAEIIQKFFLEVYNIQFNYYKTHNNSYVMCANTKDSIKFVSLITPYIIPSMEYKIRHVLKQLRFHENQTP